MAGKKKSTTAERIQVADATTGLGQKIFEAGGWLYDLLNQHPWLASFFTLWIGGGGLTVWAAGFQWWMVWPAVPVLFAIFSFGLRFWNKRNARDQAINDQIDREKLAKELEDMSRKIAGLVGEYHGPMMEEWWKVSGQQGESAHVGRSRIEGKLIEKYSDRFAADVWRLIRRTSKVVQMKRTDFWHIGDGARSEHEIVQVYKLLASLADDVRTMSEPIPLLDDMNPARKSK